MKKKKLLTRKNMHKSKKAQGNLESLILIGGAVLISVVIISVLISMGGQGRDGASTQGDQISSSTDGPLPPTIVSVNARYSNCYAIDPSVSTDKVGLITFAWRPLSKEGTFKLVIQNSKNEVLGDYDYVVTYNSELQDSKNLNPNILNNLIVSDIPIGQGACGDTYYLSIDVSKNNQTKSSSRYAFRWSEQGEKTTLVSRPSFSPTAGTYNIAQFPLNVSLIHDPTYAVYYTTDGTDPTVSGTRAIYSSQISVTPNTTIRAVSEYAGIYSGVLTGTFTDSYYTVSSVNATPGSQINLQDPIDVSLVTSTELSIIYFTLDSSTPDCSGSFTQYMSPINVSNNATIKAIACRTNYLPSSVSTFTYTFFVPLDPVVITPPGGTYTSIQNVTLSNNNAGATIRYTTTGVDPTEASPIYSGPINVSSSRTIKAIAYVGSFSSIVSQADYNITLPAIAPTFSPVPGTYNTNQSILLNTTTPLPYTIRYTTDGTDPDETSNLYTGSGVYVSNNLTLKARVYKTDWSASPVTSGVYNFALSAPTFSPSPGAYSDSQVVSINSVAGAQISYTLDGSNPVQGGPNIINSGESIIISSTSTIRAIAYKSGWSSSPVAQGTFIINAPAASPVFSPNGGTHTNSVNVTLSCSTPSSTIRYTTDGSTPTRDVGNIYSSVLNLAATTTINAVCYANGYSTSPVSTQTFTIQYLASPVVLSPLGGNFSTNQSLTMTTSTPLPYTIRYTTDGTDPTPSSASYVGAIPLTQNQTIKARAYKTGYQESVINTQTYNFVLSSPTFSPTAPSNHADSVSVQINSVAGAQIRYTLDGSNPTQTTGTLINAGESTTLITSTSTLKAIAYKTGWSSSPIAQGIYTINAPAAAPVFSPDGGTHTNSVTVTLSCSTPSSTIRYTTDGSTPTRDVGNIYSSALNFTTTTTVKAVCYATGYSTSAVIEKLFTIQLIASSVTFSPDAGTFSTNQAITLSTLTSSPYTIRYTTDGTDPTPSSASYVSAIPLTQNQTIKARVYKTGYHESAITTAVYNFVLSAPTFSPTAPSNHADSVSVQINSVAGAQIRYTLDGSNPTQTTGTLINTGESTSPITSTSVLKAIAYKTGWSSSPIAQGTFTINAPAATPVFSPAGGTHTNSVTVTLSCSTPSSTIRYTTDGSTPTRDVGNIYSSALNFTTTTTLKAVCYATGYSTSAVATQTFTIQNPPGSVTVSGGGTFCNSATLTASGGTGGLIYFQGTTSNGTSTANQTTTANVTLSGTYYFRAYSSTTDLWGTQGSAAVTIRTNSTAPTSITGTNTICSGQSTILTAQGGTLGTGATYQWYAGGCGSGSVLGTNSSLTVSPTATTTYYARISGTCNTTSCVSRTVTVAAPPTVNVTNGSNCGPGTVTLGATTTSGTIAWYTTSTGGSPVATGNSYTTPSLSTTTTYYVDVSGGTCALSSRVPVTATINSVPAATTVSLQSTAPGTATISASGGSGGTIYFQATTSNGTSTSLGTTPQTVTNSATYYFRSMSTAGCWGPQGSLAVTIPAGLSNLVLSNNPSDFSFNSSTYTYNNIRYLISTTNSITVTPTGSGTITVNGSPVTSGSASSPISISDGLEKTITVQVTQGASSATYTLNVRKIITSGGTVTEGISGGFAWKVHRFTSGSGTFSSNIAVTGQLLVVGGGGGGGGYNGNGGNAGQYSYFSNQSISSGNTSVSVGNGGAGGQYNAQGTSGGSSSFGTVTASGGTGGASSTSWGCPPQNRGGSNGVGTLGTCYVSPPGYGPGAAGISNSITGSSLVYAAGGHSRESGGQAGGANTGNGGDGKAISGSIGQSGGSGVVIIRVQIPI